MGFSNLEVEYSFLEYLSEAYSHVNKELTLRYIVFTLLGLRIQAEVVTNQGRIDAVIELKDTVYIFEFKLNRTKKAALAQINRKQYVEKYLDTAKQLVLMGVEFNKKTRNIGKWVTQ